MSSQLSTNLESRNSTLKFERYFHKDLYKWVAEKVNELGIKDAEILDMSVDSVIFSQILAEKLKAKRLVSAMRHDTLLPGTVLTTDKNDNKIIARLKT